MIRWSSGQAVRKNMSLGQTYGSGVSKCVDQGPVELDRLENARICCNQGCWLIHTQMKMLRYEIC